MDIVGNIQKLIGKTGRVAEDVLQKTPQSVKTAIEYSLFGVPGMVFKPLSTDYGILEKMQEIGAIPLTPEQRVEKLQQQQKTPEGGSPNPIEYTLQLQKGYVTPQATVRADGQVERTPPVESLIDAYKQQGWTDENAIRADIASGGWKTKINQTSGSSSPSGQEGRDAVGEFARGVAQNPEMVKGMAPQDMDKILRDMVERGMSFADATLARRREMAERFYQEAMETAQRQREEVAAASTARKGAAKEQEEFYKGEMEKRKTAEIEEIEAQKQKAQVSYENAKDEIAKNWRDLSKRFEAQARALGATATSFVFGETRKLLNEFNSNLAKAWNSHKETVDELNRAVKKTIDTYDSKMAELEMQTRQAIQEIDLWEQEQIGRIRDMEGKALSYKMELISDAAEQAEQLKKAILDRVDEAKLNWATFVAQLQTQFALSAKYAAQNNIDAAKQSLDASNKFLNFVKLQSSIGNTPDLVKAQKPDGIVSNFLIVREPLSGQEYSMDVGGDEEKAKKILQTLKNLSLSPLEALTSFAPRIQ